MAKKTQLTRNERRNEMYSNRLTTLFLLATFFIVILLIGESRGAHFEYAMYKYVTPIAMIASALGIIACIVWGRLEKKKYSYNAEEDYRTVKPSALIALLGGIFGVAFAYHFLFVNSYNYKAIVTIIALAVLAFVHDSYGRDFFVISAVLMASAVCCSTLGVGFGFAGVRLSIMTVTQVLAFVIPAALLVAVLFFTDSKGRLKLGQKKYRFIGSNAKKLPFIILSFVILIIDVLCVIPLGFISLKTYGLIAFFATYLVYGIIYTVKQLKA